MLHAEESISGSAEAESLPPVEAVSFLASRLREGACTGALRLFVGFEAAFCSPDIIHDLSSLALVICTTRRTKYGRADQRKSVYFRPTYY